MVFRNACTVQPKAWPAGGAVTVAGSELIRIPSPRGTRPIEDAHSAGGRGWISRAVRWRWARVSHEAGCGWQRGESRFGFTRREAGRYSGTILNRPGLTGAIHRAAFAAKGAATSVPGWTRAADRDPRSPRCRLR
jgi:hypothetical protein